MQKLRSLEMLRAIAALLVVSFHAPIILAIPVAALPLHNIVHSGYRGVDLFFVLSGFIITHIHAGDIGRPSRLGNYAFNRIARIYPAVLIVTLGAAALSALGWGIADAAIRPGSWNAVASAFLLPQSGDAIVNVTWSLKYELAFYLFFAALILNPRLGAALFGTWALALLTVALASNFKPLGVIGLYLRPISLEFGVGMVCAWAIDQPGFVRVFRMRSSQWGLLALGVGAFVGGMSGAYHTHFTDVLCATGAGAIIVALVLLESAGRLRVPDILVMLGGASYAIYLVHYSAISLLAHAFAHVNAGPVPTVMFLPAVAFGTAAGVMFDHMVDRPLQHALKGRLKPLLLSAKPRPLRPMMEVHDV